MASNSQIMRARLHLMAELHAGSRPPGAAISIKETAILLKLSPTPVREALARLAGEGMVTTSGDRNGFAVPYLSPSSYADLIEFTVLLIEAAVGKCHLDMVQLHELPIPVAVGDPVAVIEATIGWLTSECENRQIVRAIERTGLVLAPYRRIEPLIIPDWPDELRRLPCEAVAGRLLPALTAYRKVRIEMAPKIVDAVERCHRTSDIFQI